MGMKTLKAEMIANNRIELKFFCESRDDFFSILQDVKGIQGRIFHPDRKSWIIPLTDESKDFLMKWNFPCSGIMSEEKTSEKDELPYQEAKDFLIQKYPFSKDLLEKLFQFQVQDVYRIEKMEGRALLGSEMGLGKTLQAITYSFLHPEIEKVLIICPASLKLNWERELRIWINAKSQVLYSKDDIRKNTKYLIVNYDILDKKLDELLSFNPGLLIIDECHYTKNTKAKRTLAVRKLAKERKHIIQISGTPILNRPIEFYTGLNILRPDLFNNWYHYAMEFCGGRQGKFGLEVSGATNTEKLNKILSGSCMIRRLKKDVLKDLPAKIKSIVPIELENMEEYSYAEKYFSEYLFKSESKMVSVEALQKIEKLKQITVKGKMSPIFDWLDNFLETDKKIVLFATHHATVDSIMQKYPGISVRLDGRDSMPERQKAIDAFQNDPNIKIFIGNIKAAGVGITLTAASDLAFIELGWSPGEHSQAEDRIHRIGQKESVNIYYFIGKNSIEEEIISVIEEKSKMLDAVLDGSVSDESSLLADLLKKYLKRIE